jgi:hypothetical protein
MGRIVIRCLQEMCEKGFDLHLRCRACRRVAVLERHQLRQWVKVLRWSSDFDDIARRFPCRQCGSGRVEWGFTPPGSPDRLDLAVVARRRRDGYLVEARFWHDLSRGRDPRSRGANGRRLR